jgi:hypothetical protein
MPEYIQAMGEGLISGSVLACLVNKLIPSFPLLPLPHAARIPSPRSFFSMSAWRRFIAEPEMEARGQEFCAALGGPWCITLPIPGGQKGNPG